MKKINRIAISGFLYGKKEAESQAEIIITNRKNKIAQAKFEWLEFIKAKKSVKEIETARLTKVKKMRKLNIKAYQILPVKCVGKRGGNWVFQSEK